MAEQQQEQWVYYRVPMPAPAQQPWKTKSLEMKVQTSRLIDTRGTEAAQRTLKIAFQKMIIRPIQPSLFVLFSPKNPLYGELV